jgi:hypothetical protein
MEILCPVLVCAHDKACRGKRKSKMVTFSTTIFAQMRFHAVVPAHGTASP